MAHIEFARSITRHAEAGVRQFAGDSIRDVLDKAFASNSQLRGYVLDDQGALRKHVVIFINGQTIQDRAQLSDPVAADDRIYVFQALSGG